jgi:acetylornithine deacetylase/succinyl-diaminopimelate desuccinylase-like protein
VSLQAVVDQTKRDAGAALERLRSHIQQPSVTTDPAGVAAILERLTRELTALGAQVELVQTSERPVLFAKIQGEGQKTVLFHCMYDVVPADEPDWIAPPFEARRMTLEGKGECIVGRGAEDTKGPYCALLGAIACYRAAGVPLPCSLMIVMEASELGSGGIEHFVREYRKPLRGADVAYFPWNTERADGTAVVWLGAKGLITMKLRAKGGDWGGPVRSDLHGSHASWVASPVHRLTLALASLRRPDDSDVAIEGFYEGKRAPSAGEVALIDRLAARVDGPKQLQELGIRRFRQHNLRDALYAYCFHCEFNLSGIKAGFVEEGGHKAYIPRDAVASLEIRPLDGMKSSQVVEAMRRHFDARGYEDIVIDVMNAYDGGGTGPENWAVQGLLATYQDAGYDPEIWPRTARSIAAGLYTEEVGIPWIATMPGHAGRQHAANEFISVAGFGRAVDFAARLLWRLGRG